MVCAASELFINVSCIIKTFGRFRELDVFFSRLRHRISPQTITKYYIFIRTRCTDRRRRRAPFTMHTPPPPPPREIAFGVVAADFTRSLVAVPRKRRPSLGPSGCHVIYTGSAYRNSIGRRRLRLRRCRAILFRRAKTRPCYSLFFRISYSDRVNASPTDARGFSSGRSTTD